jgi:hypothetical protein
LLIQIYNKNLASPLPRGTGVFVYTFWLKKEVGKAGEKAN